ncbi:MAG TPA: YceI family protein [bacterium]|nr:YceI family protein [bacterium]
MKKLFLFLAAFSFLAVSTVRAEVYGFDKAHSQIGFAVRHILSPVHGEFKDYDGTIHFDPKNPEDARISVTIQVDSINTDNEMRDHHLKTPDFFDAEKYPTITFKSTKITTAGDNQYKVEGDLTMHGVTKSVVLDTTYDGSDTMMGAKIAGFSATTKIDRRDFGITFNKVLESGNLMVGNDVTITLDIALMDKAGLEKMKAMMSKPKEAPTEAPKAN